MMLRHFIELKVHKHYDFTKRSQVGFLTFSLEDPMVIRIHIPGDDKGQEVSRELLESGLKRYSGLGDLRIYPSGKRWKRSSITLRVGSSMTLTMARKPLKRFLEQVREYSKDEVARIDQAIETELLATL